MDNPASLGGSMPLRPRYRATLPCYAIRGTERASGATSERKPAGRYTPLSAYAICLCACYAMSGADTGYGATRCPGLLTQNLVLGSYCTCATRSP
eukprot:869006-Rhodomonas_salina.4